MNNISQTATRIFALPYDLDARGFYFCTAEDFTIKAASLTNSHGQPVEEFELQWIDGEDGKLFDACGINQTNLDIWFDEIEGLESWEKASLFYLVGLAGYKLEEALERVEDVSLYQGALLEAATELFDSCYLQEIPENVRSYINYESFANDCRLGGDMVEFDYDGSTWTVTNANGL